jgi:NDP-sugar pyrophosphorylase family protein
MPDIKRFSLEQDVFPALVGKGFYGFCVDTPFYDIGTPERYEAARQALERLKQ